MQVLSLYSILLGTAVAHLLMTAVMALFARHKVQYLSIAWIMGIFTMMVAMLLSWVGAIERWEPGMLHPVMLLFMVGIVFLQSIYPLSITMPAYLQWGRMVSYALPAIFLFAVYGFAMLLGVRPVVVDSWEKMREQLFSSDLLLRFSILALCIYYIINIFRLPKVMLRNPDTPNYLFGYAFALGLSLCVYVWLVLDFSLPLLEIYVMIFSGVNLYLCFRTLETMALSLPHPALKELPEEESAMQGEIMESEESSLEKEDFNEANTHRFEHVEHWMQHNREAWKDNSFGRDQLCEAVGLNRHLLLQSIRSQGYNNIHEYINAYRINELQRMIAHGEVRTLTACMDAGFGTIKTARSAYERVTGKSLDDCLAKHKA